MTKLSEKKGGGLIYNPPRMLFDGSTGYYSATYTSSGNKVTIIARFKIGALTGDVVRDIARSFGPSTIERARVVIASSDNTSVPNRQGKIFVVTKNSGSSNVCLLVSSSTFLDDQPHTLFYAFDGDAGTAVLRIDGVDEDDTGNADRVAPTTGTLASGASSDFLVGSATTGGSNYWPGEIGYVGMRDVSGLTWSDYMDQYGNPKQTDFSGWLFGHFAGKMDENEGTAGAMTKNGTITLVDPGVCPHIGLPTIGTAEAWDIKTGKIAWVDGVEKVGTGYFPAGMVFDGTSGFYSASYTSSGNKITVVARFKIASFTGDVVKFLCEIYGTSVANTRARIAMASSNHSTLTGRRSKLFVLTENSSNTAISFIVTSSTFDDDEWHTLFYEFDGDAGTAVLRIDGADEIDVANGEYVAATTGTLDSGASSTALVGSLTAAGSSYWSGDIGFFGYRDVGGLSWSDFMQTDGSPKQLDESTWTEWGAQPLFWHESGKMDENLGSAGAMTANGTITLASASSWS